jgi:hypothetical protein
MPSWVTGVVGTFALSLVLGYGLLRLRCRGIGPVTGRCARPWALLIAVGTAVLSAAVGLLIVAVSDRVQAAFVGVLVPGGLWFTRLPLDRRPGPLAMLLTVPFTRLYDRMGDDMEAWCDVRLRAAAGEPKWIADAVTYYHHQVADGLKDPKARADLARWRDSITHKIGVVRLINLDTTQARLRASLQAHGSTAHVRKYAADDPVRLAERLETEALNELHLFLAYVYRLGHHKMLIYPFRPSAQRAGTRRAEPTAPDR